MKGLCHWGVCATPQKIFEVHVCPNAILGVHISVLICGRLKVKSRDSRKSRQKRQKNTAPFCENRGKITAGHIAANLLKLMVCNSRKYTF